MPRNLEIAIRVRADLEEAVQTVRRLDASFDRSCRSAAGAAGSVGARGAVRATFVTRAPLPGGS